MLATDKVSSSLLYVLGTKSQSTMKGREAFVEQVGPGALQVAV